ncbi:MAG: DNA-J related domain-containing protein [Pseudomonadota bacterium]
MTTPAVRPRRCVAPPLVDADPRLPLLECLLAAHPEGLREHDLLRALARRQVPPFTDRAAGGDLLDLFQRHFILRHLLHRLRDRRLASGRGDIELDTLGARLTPHPGRSPGGMSAPEPLRAYYLDPAELAAVDAADVAALLADFWRRYRRYEQRDWAWAALELEPGADSATVRYQYRRLASRWHPDRGGDGARLARINAAFAVLVGSRT